LGSPVFAANSIKFLRSFYLRHHIPEIFDHVQAEKACKTGIRRLFIAAETTRNSTLQLQDWQRLCLNTCKTLGLSAQENAPTGPCVRRHLKVRMVPDELEPHSAVFPVALEALTKVGQAPSLCHFSEHFPQELREPVPVL